MEQHDSLETKPLFSQNAKSSISLRHIFFKVWTVCGIAGMLSATGLTHMNMYVPFLYTRVNCCALEPLDSIFDVKDLKEVNEIKSEAMKLGFSPVPTQQDGTIHACDVPAFPSTNKHWSLSPTCVNAGYVRKSAQDVVSLVVTIQRVFVFFLISIIGSLTDKIGRAPLLFLSCAMEIFSAVLLMLEAHKPHQGVSIYLIMGTLCFAFTSDPRPIALNAWVADTFGNVEKNKSVALTIITICSSLGTLLGNIGGFFMLHAHLSSYTSVFAILGAINLFTFFFTKFFFKESMPSERRHPFRLSMLNPWKNWVSCIALVRSDAAIRMNIVICCINSLLGCGFQTTMMSYMTSMGFQAYELVLAELVAGLAVPLLTMIALPVIKTTKLHTHYILGYLLLVMSTLIWGPYTMYVGRSGPYLAIIIGGFGSSALLGPASITIMSQRVGEDHQGTLLSTFSLASCAGAAIGPLFYSRFVYHPTAQGIAKAVPAIVTAAGSTVTFVYAIWMLRYCEVTSPQPDGLSPRKSDKAFVLAK